MHPETRKEIGYLLTLYAEQGEDRAVDYIRHHYLKGAAIPDSYRERDSVDGRPRKQSREPLSTQQIHSSEFAGPDTGFRGK